MRQFPYPIRVLGHWTLGRIALRIRGGINRGAKWGLVAFGRGYGSGTFDAARLAALAAITRPGDTFYDIGAHKGYVTLAAARMVGPHGRVVAFEPAAQNVRGLRRHLAWNGVRNVEVVSVAVSDGNGATAFGGTGSSTAFRMGEGPETVPVRTLAQVVEERTLPLAHVVKIDVEGEEAAVLRGMGPLLGGDQALLVSTHSRPLYDECRNLLENRGFRIFSSSEIAQRLATGARWRKDHDLLAFGPDRTVDEDEVAALQLISGTAATPR